jgi:hypothetical protein
MQKANNDYPTRAQVDEMLDAYEKDGVLGIARLLTIRRKERREYLAAQANSDNSAKPATQKERWNKYTQEHETPVGETE